MIMITVKWPETFLTIKKCFNYNTIIMENLGQLSYPLGRWSFVKQGFATVRIFSYSEETQRKFADRN